MARRLIIFIAASFALLGFIVGGGLIWATSASGSKYISARLKKNLNRETGLDLSFGNIDIHLFPPRFGISMIKANQGSKRIACTVQEAEVSPRLLDLLQGTLSIEEVYIGSPHCDIKLDKSDMDLLALREIDTTDSPVDLDLSQLPFFDVFAVSDGALRLKIDDPGRLGNIQLEMSGFGLDVTGKRVGGKVEIEVRGLIETTRTSWKGELGEINESASDMRFRAALTENAVNIRELNAVVGGASLDVRDAHVPLPLWPQGPDIADLSISTSLDLVNRLPLDLPHLEGNANFLGRLSAQQTDNGELNLSTRGNIEIENLAIDEFVVGDLRGLFSLTPYGVAFSETELRAAEGVLQLSGNIAFDEELTTDVSTVLDDIELAHLLEQLTVRDTYVVQRMTGPVRLQGTLNPLRLEGPVRISVKDHQTLVGSFRSRNPDVALRVPRALVTGDVAITDQFFDAPRLWVQGGDTRLAVGMSVNFENQTWRLEARSKDFHMKDIEERIAGFQIGGNGPLSCTISGKLDDPQIVGKTSLESVVFEGMHFDEATTEIHFHHPILSFDDLHIRRNKSRLMAKDLVLDFGSRSGLAVHTKIDAENVAITDLADTFAIDTKPWGTPSGFVRGSVAIDYGSKPEHMNISSDLVHEELEIFGERFGSDALQVDWNDGQLTVTQFGLKKGRGIVSITGAMLPDESINFIGVVTAIDSATLDNPFFKRNSLGFEGQAFVVVEGTLDHPKGWADVRLNQITYRNIRYGLTNLDVQLDGKKITSEGKVGDSLAILEHLNIDLDRERFELEGFVSNLDIARLFEIKPSGHKLELKVTGEMALGGKLSDEPELHGHAELNDVAMTLDDLNFHNDKPLKIKMTKSVFSINPTRFSGKHVVFDLGGTLDLESIALRIKGITRLVFASSIVDSFEKTNGLAEFEIRATGPFGSPSLTGEAEIKKGSIRIRDFPYGIKNIAGRVQLRPGLIEINDFSAQAANGSLSLNGEIQLDEWDVEKYMFSLVAEKLDLSLIDNLTFKASTTKEGLLLRSPEDDGLPRVTGDIEIRDLRYTQPIRIVETSDLNPERLAGRQTRAKKPKLIDPKNDVFAFDVNLHGERNLEAHNNIFDVDVIIDDQDKPLRFIGTNQSFGFVGRVLGKKGQVRFAGRRFDVKTAEVEFQDPLNPGNPRFRVTAEGQIRDWSVLMTAEGTVNDYELKFSSQPRLPKEDVISLILHGLTRSESKQYGPGLDILPLLSQSIDQGRQEIPVEIRIYNHYSEKAGTDTTRVAIGRWVTDDVWVSLSSSVGQEREVEAELDYKINEGVSLSAGYEKDDEGSIGNMGLDLKFRLEF